MRFPTRIITEARRQSAPSTAHYEVQMTEEEFEDPQTLGDTMFNINFTVVADYTAGEEMVRYNADGSGYPGSDPIIEWSIIGINSVDAYDRNGDEIMFELTEEWKKKLITSLNKNLDPDEVEDKLLEYIQLNLDADDYAYEAEYDHHFES